MERSSNRTGNRSPPHSHPRSRRRSRSPSSRSIKSDSEREQRRYRYRRSGSESGDGDRRAGSSRRERREKDSSSRTGHSRRREDDDERRKGSDGDRRRRDISRDSSDDNEKRRRRREHRRYQSPFDDVDRIRQRRHSKSMTHDEHRRRRGEDSKPLSQSEPQSFQRKGPLPSQHASFTKTTTPQNPEEEPLPEKQLPNLQSTGLLAAASNTLQQANGQSTVLKYHEPPEARKPPPSQAWKLFVFKGSASLETIELSLRSCWLIGREVAVCDLAAEHPSISKQHAVLQFRNIEKRNEFGDKIGKVRPYLIDLESANGSLLNGESVPAGRYLELRDKDVLRFGDSEREYVVMLPPK